MRSGVSTQMITNLRTLPNMTRADLITITLLDGTVLAYTTYDRDIEFKPINRTVPLVYSSKGPYPIIQGYSSKPGTKVDALKLELWTLYTNIIEGAAVLAGAADGLFDTAIVQHERVYMPTPGDVSAGSVPIFLGICGQITELDNVHLAVEVNDYRHKMNIEMPYRVFQPQCGWPLYGPGCGLSRSAFAVNGIIGSGSASTVFNTNLTNPDNYFSEGTIQFQTGILAGASRSIRLSLATGQLLLYLPFASIPAPGDLFVAYPGCDKTFATCVSKFSNGINFAGTEFIAVAETAV